VFLTYENWVLPGHVSGQTHNVSCTLVVNDKEWDEAFGYIWQNRTKLSSMTFLPKQSDKEIPFCPREAVTTVKDVAQFESLVRAYKPVNYTEIMEDEDTTIKDAACNGDHCELGLDYCTGIGLRVFQGTFDEKHIKSFQVRGLKFVLYKQFEGYFLAKRIE